MGVKEWGVDVVVMSAVVMTLGYLGTAGSSILLNTFAYIVVFWGSMGTMYVFQDLCCLCGFFVDIPIEYEQFTRLFYLVQ